MLLSAVAEIPIPSAPTILSCLLGLVVPIPTDLISLFLDTVAIIPLSSLSPAPGMLKCNFP